MKYLTPVLVASIVLCGVACSSSANIASESEDFTASQAPLARFAPHIAKLREQIEKPATTEEAANALLASGRPTAFSLQAISRLYSDDDPQFKKMQKDFKALEDGIGAYAKWRDVYNAAVSQNAPKETQDRLKKNSDEALVAFKQMLTDGGWRAEVPESRRLAQIESFLKNFKWLERSKDRAVILGRLGKELKDIAKTEYDMTHLEEGDGVHELRRDIRWVLIEQATLNGMIVLKPGQCPIPAYANLPLSGRFTDLRPSPLEPNPCQISQCVVVGANKLVEEIGGVKDQIETGINIAGDSDLVPEQFQAQVAKIYADMKSTNVIGTFAAELAACKASLPPTPEPDAGPEPDERPDAALVADADAAPVPDADAAPLDAGNGDAR